MKSFLIGFAFFAMFHNTGSNRIDFTPKQLFHEIKKISRCENPVYKPMGQMSSMNTDSSSGIFYEYSNALPVKYSYVGRVNTCRASGCDSPDQFKITERSEFFDYFILFDSVAKILALQIYNYEASHGQEITVKGWLKQFVGFNADKQLTVGKDIDVVSGATVSVHSITDDVNDKTTRLKTYLQSISGIQMKRAND